MRRLKLISVAIPAILVASFSITPASSAGPGTLADSAYAQSYGANGGTNVFATTQRVSCYRPEVPFAVNGVPNDGFSGDTACRGATSREDVGDCGYST